MHLNFFMLLLHVSAAAASHHQEVSVAVTNTSLSDTSLYQHLVFAALTLCSLQTLVGFTAWNYAALPYVGTMFTCDVTHYNLTNTALLEFLKHTDI
jgi:hypothetical protein